MDTRRSTAGRSGPTPCSPRCARAPGRHSARRTSVAINRTRTLKEAEKLLRQGRLDAAIEEYQRVLAEFPHDWTTANILGDCYYRAQQADKAVEQYVQIADHLLRDGLTQPAGALYRKILKIKPDHDHALLQAA